MYDTCTCMGEYDTCMCVYTRVCVCVSKRIRKIETKALPQDKGHHLSSVGTIEWRTSCGRRDQPQAAVAQGLRAIACPYMAAQKRSPFDLLGTMALYRLHLPIAPPQAEAC